MVENLHSSTEYTADPVSVRWMKTLSIVLVIAVVVFFGITVLGGIVKVNGAGGECLDWPTCLGNWLPPDFSGSTSTGLDYFHRALTALGALAIFVVIGIVGFKFRQLTRLVRILSAVIIVLTIQILLGKFLIANSVTINQSWISGFHLALSMVVQFLLIFLALLTFQFQNYGQMKRMVFRSQYSRLSLVNLASIFILFVSGLLVSRSLDSPLCTGWPLCLPQNLLGWFALSHRMIVGVSALLLTVLFIQSWRKQRSRGLVLVAATAAFTLFWAQAILGSQMVGTPPPYLIVLHQATAASIWIVMVVQIAAVGFAGRTDEEERLEATTFRFDPGLFRDFLSLTKPVVVALLLVTTYAGMVIGSRSLPPLNLVFWTLLGGFMAAGGSGAINQFIDREDDSRMQRTQKRPIPSGRLTPAEGLAFGVAMLLTSFYVLVAFVNLLSALLSLAGMIYYVVIYSLILKKTTVQNIVIGGGAGAIPPLVGWAAATGSLNIPSLFLFAVVFMWTPPHFWALALVRRKDYARAGVPMLPVVRGEKATRWQIFLYTLELVVLTLLLPLFGLGGSVYLVGAGLLGLWLGWTAWRVWKVGGNKLAWKMYRFSSMYLAFLFIVLMVDALRVIK